MNLRQKVKHYKKLVELYSAKTIQSNISYQQFETKHFRNVSHFNPYLEDESMAIQFSEERLLESIKPLIVTRVVDDEVLGGKRIQSDIWVVDRY